jgi:hypothetical protein
MANEYHFKNSPAPITLTGPAVSGALNSAAIYVQATVDCFICVSPDGTGVNGAAVSATNGHFISGGSGVPLIGINPMHKIGVNTGTLYVSSIS